MSATKTRAKKRTARRSPSARKTISRRASTTRRKPKARVTTSGAKRKPTARVTTTRSKKKPTARVTTTRSKKKPTGRETTTKSTQRSTATDTIRLEWNRLKINRRNDKAWELYMVLAAEDPRTGKTAMSIFPEEIIKLTKRSDNIWRAKAGGKGADGLTVIEGPMPEDRHLKVRMWLMKSRRRARNTGAIMKEISSGFGKKATNAVAATGAGAPIVVGAKVVNAGVGAVGDVLKNMKDKNLGMVNLDEDFDTGFSTTNKRKRIAHLSSGDATLTFCWVIDRAKRLPTATVSRSSTSRQSGGSSRPRGYESSVQGVSRENRRYVPAQRSRPAPPAEVRSVSPNAGRELAPDHPSMTRRVDELVTPLVEARAEENGVDLVIREGRRVPHFFQGDSRWNGRTLGESSSIGEKGCAITSIAMVLRYYGREVTPETLDRFLDENNGYQGNSVVWGMSLKHGENGGPRLVAMGRVNESAADLDEIINARLDAGHPTLARVDYKYDSTYDHFVVIVGRNALGQYVINDPGLPDGDGAGRPESRNAVLETHERGYDLVAIDPFDVQD